MTDVLKIALDRRSELSEEIDRLDAFVRIADSLLCKLQPQSEPFEEQQDSAEPGAAERSSGAARELQGASAQNDSEAGYADGHQSAAGNVAPGRMRMNLLRRGPTTISG